MSERSTTYFLYFILFAAAAAVLAADACDRSSVSVRIGITEYQPHKLVDENSRKYSVYLKYTHSRASVYMSRVYDRTGGRENGVVDGMECMAWHGQRRE